MCVCECAYVLATQNVGILLHCWKSYNFVIILAIIIINAQVRYGIRSIDNPTCRYLQFVSAVSNLLIRVWWLVHTIELYTYLFKMFTRNCKSTSSVIIVRCARKPVWSNLAKNVSQMRLYFMSRSTYLFVHLHLHPMFIFLYSE